jgi:hypothetical protein
MRDRRARRTPWGSLAIGLAFLVVAAWALIAIPASTATPRGSLVPAPMHATLPATWMATTPTATRTPTARPTPSP